MTFKAKVYKLTKEVKKSEKRQELQALIHDLSYGKADPSDSADRSHLGYLARQKGMQFLSFLFIDKERDALLQNHPFPIPAITNDERLLLAGAHENLLRLNQKCIEVIGEQDIDFGNVLNPFKEERYIPSDHMSRIRLFSDADIRIVQQAFSLHPAIGVVKDALALLRRSNLNVEQCIEFTKVLEDNLTRTGPMNNPKMVEESITASRQNEGFRHWLRFSVACLSLKASLESLNQLIFQATKEDKLALLSGDNIIQIKGGGHNLAARSHHVAYQFSSHAGFIEPREIVLLKYSIQSMHIDSLCRTGATRISMSAELGDSVEAEFWEFDDYLNPYAPLLNIVERLN